MKNILLTIVVVVLSISVNGQNKVFKGANGWVIGDETVPTAKYRLNPNADSTSAEIKAFGSEYRLIRMQPIAKFKKENGDSYSNYLELQTVLRDFVGTQAIVQLGDAPIEYTKATASGATFLIQKGQLNNLRLRPQIINEQAESSRKIQGVVTSSNIVGQIFKASQDNINGIELALESAAGVDFDDFESYADSPALQAAWIATGTEATLDVSNPHTGSKCMAINGFSPVGNEWERTFLTTDFSNYTGQFWMYATNTYTDVKMRVFVRDAIGNTSSAAIVTVGALQYYNYVVDTESLVADGATAADLTDIVGIGFRIEKRRSGSIIYIDDMVSVPNPGSVDLELWYMGTTLPVSTVTSIDDGIQYNALGDLGITGDQLASVNLPMKGGKRTYHVDEFVAGVALEIPGNVILPTDAYYAITINYVDTDVSVYGPNDSWDDYYINGYGFTTPDASTAITAIGDSVDLMFIIYSTQDVYIDEISAFVDQAPNGNSSAGIYVEDVNMKRTNVLLSNVKAVQVATQKLARPFFLAKGGKLEEEYNDDFTDNVSSINFIFQYYFIPKEANE